VSADSREKTVLEMLGAVSASDQSCSSRLVCVAASLSDLSLDSGILVLVSFLTLSQRASGAVRGYSESLSSDEFAR
jgi:hypothetical protein